MSITEQGAATTPRQAVSFGRWLLRGLVVLLLLIVLLALLGVGGWLAYVQVKKSAPSFHLALATVQKDPQVIQALGEPIEDASLLPSGDENVEAERGDADWWFNVKGPEAPGSRSRPCHTPRRQLELEPVGGYPGQGPDDHPQSRSGRRRAGRRPEVVAAEVGPFLPEGT